MSERLTKVKIVDRRGRDVCAFEWVPIVDASGNPLGGFCWILKPKVSKKAARMARKKYRDVSAALFAATERRDSELPSVDVDCCREHRNAAIEQRIAAIEQLIDTHKRDRESLRRAEIADALRHQPEILRPLAPIGSRGVLEIPGHFSLRWKKVLAQLDKMVEEFDGPSKTMTVAEFRQRFQ